MAYSISPQFWNMNSYDQFAKGDPQSISITSDGELVLAPVMEKLYEGTDSILWKVVRDSNGTIYAATGNDGRVLKIGSDGKATVVLDTEELEVHALVSGEKGDVFAGTSPGGKIYRIKSDGSSSVFFDPQDKYIWSLARDDKGNLYAGTGDQGKIYKITPQGEGTLLADTSESNITALAWNKTELLAGSDNNGILYRIENTGTPFVLYDSEYQQITAIYPDKDGSIYFSAIAGISPATASPETSPGPKSDSEPASQGTEVNYIPQADVVVTISPADVNPVPPSSGSTGTSSLFRLTADGVVETFFTLREDQILDMNRYRDQGILLATGKKAKLILVDDNKKGTILVKIPEEQITGLLVDGEILAATANPGNIYRLSGEHSTSGTYFSEVKDVKTVSTWGRISWKAETPPGSSLEVFTRSGNTGTPDETWSEWSSAGSDSEGRTSASPKARFAQWKAVLSTTDIRNSPVLQSLQLAYLQQNIRPDILSFTIQPAGTVFKKGGVYPQDSYAGLAEVPEQDRLEQEQMAQTQVGETAFLGKKEYRQGYQTITWNAQDLNQDTLSYDIQYRSVDESKWNSLAKDLNENIFAFDTRTLPDGSYVARLIASDRISNPANFALQSEKISQPFDIDNAAPSVEVLQSSRNGGTLVFQIKAQDEFSAIKQFEYSVIPGKWELIFPIDSINDSRTEEYRLELKTVPPDAANIIFKVSDQLNNSTTSQFRLPR